MPVKKSTTKAAPKKTTAKKPTTKKPATKKFTSKSAVTKKPTVTVETKKTTNTSSCVLKDHKVMRIIFILLLLGNLVFGILNLMKQDSALKLEEMKVGGEENFTKVMKLYNSDFYKKQQTAAIQQFMAQADQAAAQAEAPTE